MNKAELGERVYAVSDAIESLTDALDVIRDAVRGTSCEKIADAYCLSSITVEVGQNHSYLASSMFSLMDILSSLEEEYEEAEEEEEEEPEE